MTPNDVCISVEPTLESTPVAGELERDLVTGRASRDREAGDLGAPSGLGSGDFEPSPDLGTESPRGAPDASKRIGRLTFGYQRKHHAREQEE